MAFEIPQDLHPDLMPLAWLLGRWEGRGHGDYPTIEKFEFGQQIDFSHNGKPYLHYVSQTYVVGEDGTKERPLAVETGFWRPKPDNKLEVVLAHPTGFAEIWYGEMDGAKIEMQTDVIARTATAKEVAAGHRLYGLVKGELLWAYDMAAEGQPLQPHLWATLVRA
ncbi:FABP family protein [Kribbella sp. ALI-6-A]|uniref:FABP family protein n=1 Tax=Kribbella sp. ALI-6-A TaxID=1933817 RepID=UPI00097C5D35|nr:FABP family protein [Kribbella sp. ALI-6-A]ONI66923.1 FABP family protein [Kribbella sp. ALI-6-A]